MGLKVDFGFDGGRLRVQGLRVQVLGEFTDSTPWTATWRLSTEAVKSLLPELCGNPNTWLRVHSLRFRIEDTGAGSQNVKEKRF